MFLGLVACLRGVLVYYFPYRVGACWMQGYNTRCKFCLSGDNVTLVCASSSSHRLT